MALDHFCQFCYLGCRIFLVARQHKHPPQVVGVDLQNLFSVLAGLGLLDPLVLVDHGDALVGRLESGLQVDDFLVEGDGFVEVAGVGEEVGIPDQDLVHAFLVLLSFGAAFFALVDCCLDLMLYVPVPVEC